MNNTDILLDVFCFQMREQIDRFECVCSQWHDLITFNSAWSRRLSLRPFLEMRFILDGPKSFVESTEYVVQYNGYDKIFNILRPKDNDQRFLVNGYQRKSRRPINLDESNEQQAENISGLFKLLNNCYVKFMHLHIREPIYNLLPLLMCSFNGNIEERNESQSAIIKKGSIALNTKIEVLCLHIMANFLQQMMKINIGENNFKEQKFESTIDEKHTEFNKNNIGKHDEGHLENMDMEEDANPIFPFYSIMTSTLSAFDEKDKMEAALYAFIKELGKALCPTVYSLYVPIFSCHPHLLLSNLAPLFPMPCCHIDIQIYLLEKQEFILNSYNQAALINFIFANNQQANCPIQKQQQPQWRRILKPIHDNNGDCTRIECCEYGFSAFTLHPFQIEAKTIQQIVKHFVGLNSTDHLIGRRIQFHTGIRIEAFRDDEDMERLCTNWRIDNLNEELHLEWKTFIQSDPTISSPRLNILCEMSLPDLKCAFNLLHITGNMANIIQKLCI